MKSSDLRKKPQQQQWIENLVPISLLKYFTSILLKRITKVNLHAFT